MRAQLCSGGPPLACNPKKTIKLPSRVHVENLQNCGIFNHSEMSIVNLYSKQQKVLAGLAPNVYRHDDLPPPLRVQIVHIWEDAIGSDNHTLSLAERLFEDVLHTLRAFN